MVTSSYGVNDSPVKYGSESGAAFILLNFSAHQAAGGVRRIAAGALALRASPC